jgi:hypothetical protein
MSNWTFMEILISVMTPPMLHHFFVVLSFVLFSMGASANISGHFMTEAANHEGHKIVSKHSFLDQLKDGTFRKEQLARFLRDRTYIASYLEHKVLDPYHPKLSSHLKIFYRSHAYRKEFHQLMGNWVYLSPSESAFAYVRHLQTLQPEAVMFHLWLFLQGETFGAQPMAGYFKKRFPAVGAAVGDFDGIKLMRVRSSYNRWLDENWGKAPVENPSEVIASSFEYAQRLFDEALKTGPAPKCNQVGMYLSEKLYSWFGI